jgi:hypothetical protein
MNIKHISLNQLYRINALARSSGNSSDLIVSHSSRFMQTADPHSMTSIIYTMNLLVQRCNAIIHILL